MSLSSEDIIQHPRLSEYENHFQHGFFTRLGGVSSGIFRGLNVGLGSSDNQDDMIENRSRVAQWFGVSPHEKLLAPYQVHSPHVWTVDDKATLENRIKADGIVTATPGVPIGVVTADCGPVLFLDAENGVVGAAHAGWKGATGGVLESTIAAMEDLSAKPNSIVAVLGPSISQKNYEVDGDYRNNILNIDTQNAVWFKPSVNDGRFMFDLQGYTVDRLKKAGVEAHSSGHCTYDDEERFFSYRRTTHRAEPDYGRQISVISILK